MGIAKIEVMHNTVAEHRSKDLTLLWVVYDKTFARQGLVCPAEQFVAQCVEVFRKVLLKLLYLRHLMLPTGSILEGHIEVVKQLFAG